MFSGVSKVISIKANKIGKAITYYCPSPGFTHCPSAETTHYLSLGVTHCLSPWVPGLPLIELVNTDKALKNSLLKEICLNLFILASSPKDLPICHSWGIS